LNEGKLPKISITDDHLTHIDIHSKAEQNAHSIAHIMTHKQLMLTKRDRPDLFPPKTGLALPAKEAGAPKPNAPEMANMMQ